MTIENMSKSILAEICRDTVLGNGKPSWHGMTSCKNDISRTRMKCPCCLAVSSQSFDVRFLQLVKSPMFHVCLGSSWTETQANHSIHYKIYKFIAELRPYEVGHTWKLEEAWLRYIKWFADSAISRTNSLLFQGMACRFWPCRSGTQRIRVSVHFCVRSSFWKRGHQVARLFAPSVKQILSKVSRCFSNVGLKGKSLAPRGERPALVGLFFSRFVEPP